MFGVDPEELVFRCLMFGVDPEVLSFQYPVFRPLTQEVIFQYPIRGFEVLNLSDIRRSNLYQRQ